MAKLIFLVLPTAAVGYFLLDNVNQYYSILQNQALQQTLYLAVGMGVAALVYSFRIRFLPTFIMLIVGLYALYKGLDQYESGEFDAFFIARRFQVFAILFAAGWLIGWGFVRLRYWSVIIGAGLLCSCIALIAKANADSVYSLLRAFMPALLYTVYIIFTAEQIYNYKDKSQQFWWFLSRRLGFFSVLAALLLGGVVYMLKKEIKATVANYGGGGKGGSNDMLKKNKDNTFNLSDYSRLGSSLSRSKQLLFCARINNFFPGTDMPNPLYLTAFYFTKFDTSTETFERDKTIPYNDLFEPDPSKIPMFHTKQDSTVIKNSLGEKLRQTVEIEVYTKSLSPETYLAPNVGFFVQPITIEKDFRGEFKSAFRAKSYVSTLNSAYFIYNVQNPQIKQFQEMRFTVLRTVTDSAYTDVDPKFMKYYTDMPTNPKFGSIGTLAHKITDTAKTPVDKVLAIRNYFLSKDENGDRLYKYTDNPGVPDLPDASKLLYFLNENHKGYCAYFAGATLFMLRSLGIPSRIAVGFLTEDRSDKNKGWYWYYANQAHAWVQVYFPGYGWLDFDTTVGNDNENRETPQPDGTPPMQPPKAWFAAEGVVENVDTLKKRMQVSVKQLIFHDKEYKLTTPVRIDMDMKVAAIYRDSLPVLLKNVQKGDEGTAVSYADALKVIEPMPGESGPALIKRLPEATPIDEVYLQRKDVVKPDEKKKEAAAAKPVSVKKILWTAVGIALGFVLLVLLWPGMVLRYFILRYKNGKPEGNKAYWAYRAATYYLHMAGMPRGTRTPMQYARDMADPQLGLPGSGKVSLTGFMNVYLKQKYAKQPLTATEQQYVSGFLAPFLAAARQKIKFSTRFFGFLNPVRSAGFFVMPEEEEKEV
ncbi:MAG: transglutaminase-like domain-containing protein [Bacteroidota bacterium]